VIPVSWTVESGTADAALAFIIRTACCVIEES
jgi:hypothetical protein